jgi:hypothetical protein
MTRIKIWILRKLIHRWVPQYDLWICGDCGCPCLALYLIEAMDEKR